MTPETPRDTEASSPISAVPKRVPDPVETRDPRVPAVPRSRGRAWAYTIPAAILLVIGIGWMLATERAKPGGAAPYDVTGTSGEKANDPEGGRRGDGEALNPSAQSPTVISDMELLGSKDQYVGHAVRFAAVPVLEVEGPHTFWVGRPLKRTLVVTGTANAAGSTAAPGELVQLSGRLASVKDGKNVQAAGLSKADQDAIHDEDVVIVADTVTRVQGAGANQGAIPEGNRSTPRK